MKQIDLSETSHIFFLLLGLSKQTPPPDYLFALPKQNNFILLPTPTPWHNNSLREYIYLASGQQLCKTSLLPNFWGAWQDLNFERRAAEKEGEGVTKNLMK